MVAEASPSAGGVSGPGVAFRPRLERLGLWLRDHQGLVRRIQWGVILAYVALLLLPLFAPVPTRHAHIWNNMVLFAQFLFWGIWWPFVLVSMVLMGRTWCGVFCPEGALAEITSRYSLGRAIPAWIKWRGWPFVAFVSTTIYGQMVSVYQYPAPVVIILGGSTLAAMAVALVYGRDKRVWCRYLCPVNGVFALLARLSPLHYRVDSAQWARHKPARNAPGGVVCAPMVAIPTMKGAAACHMCGRCAGFRGGVTLEARSPAREIAGGGSRDVKPWDTWLIVFGLMGVAAGAFHWASSPLFVAAKQAGAEWLYDKGLSVLMQPVLPWWILTNYPDQSDMMTPLDGAVMIAYVLATAAITGGVVSLFLALGTRALGRFQVARFHHLAQGLIPMAGCGVFLGLSAVTVKMLREEGLDLGFVPALRGALLLAATTASLILIWRIAGRYNASVWSCLFCTLAGGFALAAAAANWVLLFWIW